MKVLDIAFSLICASHAVETSDSLGDRHDDADYENNVHFLQHIFRHNLSYETKAEFDYRKGLFVTTDARIDKFNQSEGRNVSYLVGHNKFSTWTDEEFTALFKGNAAMMSRPTDNVCDQQVTKEETNATPINWVSLGGVTSKIYDYGSCTADWAIAIAEAIEGASFVNSGRSQLRQLSAQQIVDCDPDRDNDTCWGGWIEGALGYVLGDDALQLSSTYTHESDIIKTQNDCGYDPDLGSVKTDNCRMITQNAPDDLISALNSGPVAVQLESDRWNFRHYKGGIYNDVGCGTDLNHAATAVGWSTEDDIRYVIIKNNWGSDWGEQGYMRLQLLEQQGPGICGINKSAFQPYSHNVN